MKVGLLTGTFDPVHLGHVAMARAAQTAFELDEVWFLVNPAPAHKSGVSEYEDRAAMVELAITDEPALRLGEKLPHNLAAFMSLTDRHSQDEFVFIVGAEVLAGMGQWIQADEVARRVKFAAVRRPGTPEPDLAGLSVEWFVMTEWAGASSGVVRSQVKQGKAPTEVDGRVLSYIRKKGLYL